MYSLRLLGVISLEGPSGPVSGRVTQRRRLALLALLGAATDDGWTRDKLIGLLWPETTDEQARRLLSDSLYVLRRELSEDAVTVSGELLRLDSGVCWTDVAAFEAAIREGGLKEAVSLYRGPFLEGFYLGDGAELEHWVDGERSRLAGLYAKALETLAQQAEDAGDTTLAVEWWQKLAAHDPYDSRIALRLMEAHVAAGNRGAAVEHARVHELLMQEAVGAGPAPEVLAYVEQLRQKPEPAERFPSGWQDAATFRRALLDARGRRILRSLATIAPVAVVLVVAGIWGLPQLFSPQVTSVAVLPFTNASSDPAIEWLSDEMTVNLINTLAPMHGLRVIPRASAFTYKDQPFDPEKVAAELDVSAVVTGSVTQLGDEYSVDVEIVNVPNNSQLWGDRYDLALAELLEIQEAMATSIAGALGLSLTGTEVAQLESRPTQDAETYQLYLRGRNLSAWSLPSDWPRAIVYFNQAIARDSSFALAYAGLGNVYANMAYYSRPREVYPKARAAAESALTIDSTLAQAHAVLGKVKAYSDWDWDAGEQELERAVDLDPNSSMALSAYAYFLATIGRFDEAITAAMRRRELDPRAPDSDYLLGQVYRYAGRYDEAIEAFQNALSLNPDNGIAAAVLAVTYSSNGILPEALAQAEKAEALLGADPDLWPLLGIAYAASGRTGDALRILEEVKTEQSERYYDPTHIGAIYDALGQADEAISWYTKGHEERSPDAVYGARTHPEAWQKVRSDPRYQDLVAALGLP